jgi:hypothetical protein
MEDQQWLFDEQDGRCAICSEPLVPGPKTHLDHDHKTGQIRGFLCRPCNLGLGFLRDSPERLARALDYLVHNRPLLRLVK